MRSFCVFVGVIVSALSPLCACAGIDKGAPAAAQGPSDENFAGRAVHIDATLARTLDDLALRAAAQLNVPGAALAIVHRREVVLERVWGEMSPGLGPVTPHTLFMIGSITKPLTTLMEAVLIDQGRISWTDPLVTLLPDFAVADVQRTRELRLWHASCACSGIPGYDMVNAFDFESVSAEQRMATLHDVRPTAALGARYQYSNLMVAAGGYAAARAADPALDLGQAYERSMERFVLRPIGMDSSTFDFARVEASEHALPHALDLDGKLRALPLSYETSVRPIRPAGGLWTTIRDMERYAATELSRGIAPDGRRVVSAQNLEERWEPRIAEEGEGYGLGIACGQSHGLRVLSHRGGSLGFGSTLVLLPESDLGIVILTNVRNGGPFEQLPFNEVLLEGVLEELFDARDRRADALLSEFARAQRKARVGLSAGVELTPEPAWLRTVGGRYEEEKLGHVELRVEQGTGVFDAGEWQSRFGRLSTEDGRVNLVLLDAPYAGTPLTLTTLGGRPSFAVPEGDWIFRFKRID